jgi:NADH:ubiquinone oxidoreductase subunit F (NADH-binding)/NADH:ubiquinone oxidoreductase subunit E
VSAAPDDDLLAAFPRERTWLLPALDTVRRREGWVSPDRLAAIGRHLRVPASEVWGVASHYPEVRLRPPGRRLVRVCTGVACRALGGRELLGACAARLGVAPGQTSADGAVTLEELDCAFACSVAPVVEVDHRLAGRVTPDGLPALLAGPADGHGGHGPPGPGAVAPPPSLPRDLQARHAALLREAERRRPRRRLSVAVGSCSAAVGARETLAALARELERRDLGDLALGETGCPGLCWAAPLVALEEEGTTRLLAGPVTAADAPALAEALAGGRPDALPLIDPTALGAQRRVLMARCGVTDPGDIADAIRRGAYRTLARALAAGRPEAVIEELRQAGLAGRGGAYFPAAVKWAGCRDAPLGRPRWIVVNAEEGEPGIFKDRHLLEGDPHGLLEGVLLAAWAVGAERGIVYVHGEADLAAARIETAIAQARQWGLLGEGILGGELSLELSVRRGLGGFVLGEETALLESIEGRRAMPRPRPPFPVEAGLWGRPTLVNNVETLCAVPPIVEHGGTWWASLGRGHGTKLFGLSGLLRRPGVVELELGGSLRALLEGLGGGSATGRPITAAVVGGPSGSIVPAARFDEPLVPRGPVNPGTGGIAALDDSVPVGEVLRLLLAYNTRESCGKCTPCREGTARLLAMLEAGPDRAGAEELAEVIQLASLCGLGQAAPVALLAALRDFPEALPGRPV